MKKILTGGLISLTFGFMAILFAIGGGVVGADAVADPAADVFKILLNIGGGFLVLGIILVASATFSLRR